jgi:translation initiation factor IF-2
MSKSGSNNETSVVRPPVVVIMGHIDHGKSTLLDYIRKSNIVAGEAGGITQHLSAYEVTHKDEKGADRKITFLDTPGHEAFSKMRARGTKTADIAILVVSAEDSVKAQTMEAWETIVASGIPYIVAINKIDKPGANVDKTKMDLTEKGIYLEGFGGDIPFAEISAKQGTNVDSLLDLILLVADLHNLTGNPKLPATGVVIESHLDPKRGMAATLIIKNGTIRKGDFLVVEDSIVGTRILENFLGKAITEATFSSPIRLVGFDKQPQVGSSFQVCSSKKEAEVIAREWKEVKREFTPAKEIQVVSEEIKLVPLIIKSDVAGTLDAIEKEITKIELPNAKFKIIDRSVGAIGEGDIRLASADKESIIVGFNVKMDPRARDLNEKEHVTVETFDIIYKLSDFLKEQIYERRPRVMTLEPSGNAKILRVFSATKDKQVVGGKVVDGTLNANSQVRILRRENEIGRAHIIEVQHNKQKARSVEAGMEFGMQIESKIEIAVGDVIEAFTMVEK